MWSLAILTATHGLAFALGQLAGHSAHRADVDRLRRRAIIAEVRCDQLGRELFMERTRPEKIEWGSDRVQAGVDRLLAEIRSDVIIDLRDGAA